jgi:Domain of Unknown Function with PDB structure (DUF3857)
VCVLLCAPALAQEPAAKPPDAAPPTEKAAESKSDEKPALPFQIQLLETHIRFETNGDSRKEVHTIVKINELAGARQFSRLGFDYNRAFQEVEIPLVKISHANGGTSEILPSAITDAPNPAVQEFPAYHDVRVKSVRILGLQDGDTIEYRVITTTAKHPLAPDFWLEHTFDRSGQVLEERYQLELPASREVQLYISPSTTSVKKGQTGEGDSTHILYEWKLSADTFKHTSSTSEMTEPDLVLTTYSTWEQFATRLGERLIPNRNTVDELYPKGKEIAQGEEPSGKWIAPLYEFVSQQIRTIDLPLGTTGFQTRSPADVLASGYATPEDKFALFAALAKNCCGVQAGLVHTTETMPLGGLPRPTLFDHILTRSGYFWMDLNVEVAPFGMIPSQFRGKTALLVEPGSNELWPQVPKEPSIAGSQSVAVDASLSPQGQLTAKVKYTMRGDNELLLRVAFHQTPKERWKEVAGLLALSDGFRGTITNVMASDPTATKEPFAVEYEITQAKFVDWSKAPVRIPALLPQIALPDLPGKTAGIIELGTPLDVQTSLTLKLPEGTTVQTPAATSVARDYATFASKYAGHLNTVIVSRHINFLKREIPTERAGDYNAFLRAVQNDQAQAIVLLPPSGSGATTP